MTHNHQNADQLPVNADPAQWQQSLEIARQACARIFRDGGNPADALVTFGIAAGQPKSIKWNKAVSLIAEQLCATPMRRAA